MKRQSLHFFLILVACSILCFGCTQEETEEEKGPEIELIRHRGSDGIPTSEITAMVAFNNKVWIGTKEGLAAYNGNSWSTFNRSNTNALGSDIIEDLKVSDNSLWVATDNGASKYDGNHWSSIYTGGRARSAIGLRGSIAVGTARGIEYASSGSNFTSMGRDRGIVNEEVSQLAYDANGNLWVGTRAGMARFSSNSFSNFTGPGKQPMGTSLIDIPASPASCQLIGNNIKVIIPYRNMLAIGTTSGLTISDMGSVWRNHYANHRDWFQRDGGIVEEEVPGNSPLKSNIINALTTTQEDLLVVGTNSGLAVLRPNGSWVDPSDIVAGIPSGRIYGLAILGDDLWIGSENGIFQVTNFSQIAEKQS